MKKTLMILLAILAVLAAYILVGGSLGTILSVRAFVPITFGVLFSTLFTYQFTEIISMFQDAFSTEVKANKLTEYRQGIMIIKNMEATTIYWSITILILAVIQILSKLRTPNELGPSIGLALVTLLYGFGLRAALFIPMESSLQRKVFQSGQ